MRNGLVRMSSKIGKQIEFLAGQPYLFITGDDLPRLEVNLNVSQLQIGGLEFRRDRRPSQCSADARQQFRHAEGLGYVIVSSGYWLIYFVFFSVAHLNPYMVRSRPDP